MTQIQGQMSIFDFLLDLSSQKQTISFDPLIEFAKRGSGFQNGKTRILKFFADNKNKQDRVKFLKDEYGYGGFAHPRRDIKTYELHSANYTGKNIELTWFEPGKAQMDEKEYSYNELSDAIDKCITEGIY